MKALVETLKRTSERGQMLVFAALFLAVVLGFAALAIDTGFIVHTRTDIQKDADAMALAGAQELCGASSCEPPADSVARSLGTPNRVSSGEAAIQFGVDCAGGTSSNHDLITVRITRYQASFLARVIGYEGGDIHACATARKFAIGGLSGARPFGLEDNCIAALNFGDTIVLKHDSATTRNCDAFQGNFGDLTLDGSGGNEFGEAVKYGSKSDICADSVPGCTNYLFSTLTGLQQGNLKEGLKYVQANTPSSCDTWAEVVTGTGVGERINPDCNPWRDDYAGVSERLWVIPIVDGMWSSGGSNSIRVKSFAIVFWEGTWNVCAGGNKCDIEVRFVEASVSLPGTAKTSLYEGATATTIALVK